MLLNTFTKEFFRPKCNPNFQSVHCVAHLSDDIGEVLPYLNTTLGGGDYHVPFSDFPRCIFLFIIS